MNETVALSGSDIETELSKLPGWKLAGGKLHREYEFVDFVSAFGFMASVALIAQRLNHHPVWSNVWNKLSVDLETHEAGGITTLDVELAQLMEGLAARAGQ